MPPRKTGQHSNSPDHQIVVVGAGPGGICAGVRLKQNDLDDFVILERAHEVGGSWRDNDYPGIGVDVPGFTYQYSFARNPNWSRLFPKGDEVAAYHRTVARDFGLLPHLRFGIEVVREEWNNESHWWELHIADGSVVTARFVISAVGAYLVAKEDPGIAGFGDFAGKILRPTDWDHSYDLAGKRVAVIGTGASSVQITPAIAPEVAQLDVYQRTPVWCIPKSDLTVRPWMQRALAVPGVGAGLSGLSLTAIDLTLRAIVYMPPAVFDSAARGLDAGARSMYRAYLRNTVEDPADRAALAPTYGLLGKRPTTSNSFLRAFNRANVDLITDAITRITRDAIVTADGTTRPIDALVLATGYELFSDPESYRRGAIVGRNGFDLGEFYAENGLQAYESVSVPGLPNRWTLVGPYSWTGTGWHALVEITAGHAVRVIAEAVRRGQNDVEVSAAAHSRYHAMIQKRGRNIQHYFTTINQGLRTYYVNSQGHMPYIRPTSLLSARRGSTHVRFDDYVFRSSPVAAQLPRKVGA
ncbi:NAD(P)/FAD-dependent oxidoreductase [Antrihabitans sp. YC2-6]|uniref:flavin-containing monooxygenase n=1 Tax=Antrihabitans sp. YC2-6 TaxID=2799498 RepID=UPI0018F3631B|nr:NAD(P)/FAD-dependent oxidoreductase [Antrihabitans sp. YC2-6]MBJ8348994.1 NAD(P)/FAD-dependent oxidoreductase [Antrihabitans sp. YC2-6]